MSFWQKDYDVDDEDEPQIYEKCTICGNESYYKSLRAHDCEEHLEWLKQDHARAEQAQLQYRLNYKTPTATTWVPSEEKLKKVYVLFKGDIDMKLPKHEASLTIIHNPHKDYYETVKQHLDHNYEDDEGWISEDDKQKCIDSNELWVIDWYPDTPVGFCTVLGSSLEIVLELANREDTE